MLQLTEAAVQELKKIKYRVQEQQPGSIPRLVLKPQRGFIIMIHAPVEGDEEVYSADEKVLVVDPETSRLLEDVTLDYKETDRGHAFAFE